MPALWPAPTPYTLENIHIHTQWSLNEIQKKEHLTHSSMQVKSQIMIKNVRKEKQNEMFLNQPSLEIL